MRGFLRGWPGGGWLSPLPRGPFEYEETWALPCCWRPLHRTHRPPVHVRWGGRGGRQGTRVGGACGLRLHSDAGDGTTGNGASQGAPGRPGREAPMRRCTQPDTKRRGARGADRRGIQDPRPLPKYTRRGWKTKGLRALGGGGGQFVGPPSTGPPTPPAHVTGTPDGPTAEVEGGGGESSGAPTSMAQNDPPDALIILGYVSWGETLLGRFAAQVVSHHECL